MTPRPRPPKATGELLVPEGYVGWILITAPGDRHKVRWLAPSGKVYRDDQCLRGGRFHVRVHAVSCRVEPVALTTVLQPYQLQWLERALAAAELARAANAAPTLLEAAALLEPVTFPTDRLAARLEQTVLNPAGALRILDQEVI